MKSLYFITTRDLTSQNGEWRLISNRAEAMYENYEIRTDAIAFTSRKKLKLMLCKKNLEKKGFAIKYISYNNIFDFMLKYIMFLLTFKIKMDKNSSIVFSGLHTYIGFIITPILFKKYYMDIHGVADEWLEYPPKRIPKQLFGFSYKTYKYLEKKMVRGSSGVLVVSNELGSYIDKSYGIKKKFKIPCGNLVVPLQKEEDNNWRRKLGFHSNDLVFVYNGGVSQWQLIPEVISLYKYISREIPNSKILFLTPDKQAILKVLESSYVSPSDYRIYEAKSKDLVEILKSCDFGFLLREKNLTNRNAFPNKFGEYISAFLPVIVTDGLKEIANIVEENEIGIVTNSELKEEDFRHVIEEIKRLKEIKKYSQNKKTFLKVWHQDLDMNTLVAEFSTELLKE